MMKCLVLMSDCLRFAVGKQILKNEQYFTEIIMLFKYFLYNKTQSSIKVDF